MRWKNFRWLILSVGVILIDQSSKYAALMCLPSHQPTKILPSFNLTLSFNSGVAFGFFSQSGFTGQILLSIVASVFSITLLVWLGRLAVEDRLGALSLSLILGGALGNLIDRIGYGVVVDFLDFYIKTYHWPIFNIADSAITIGVLGLIWQTVKKR